MNLAAIILVLTAVVIVAVGIPHIMLAISSWRDRARLARLAPENDYELVIDESDEEPPVAHYTARCSCGWKLLHGPATGYLSASSSDEAVRKVERWHDRCLCVQPPSLIAGEHYLHVSSFNPPK
jgi:hypothetical protein